jgi:hypothetical protein
MVKRILWILGLVALGVFFIHLGCPKELPKGICYATSDVYSFQLLETSKVFGFVKLLYEFPLTLEADSVVIERVDPPKRSVVEFNQSLVWSDFDTLKADAQYRYALSLLTADEETAYDTATATTLPEILITQPKDTVFDDTLTLEFKTIARGEQHFNDYEVVLLKGMVEPESLMVKLDTVWSGEFEVAGADTLIRIPRGDWALPDFFTIKVSTSRLVKYITDSSTGYRAFLWFGIPLPTLFQK